MQKTSWIKLALQAAYGAMFSNRSEAINYGRAHSTTRAKPKGPNATSGKRQASLT